MKANEVPKLISTFFGKLIFNFFRIKTQQL
jgi:hypothetical protein